MESFATLMNWIWDSMGNMIFSIGGFSFSLRGVFIVSILFTLLGYLIGKVLNPWSGDEE